MEAEYVGACNKVEECWYHDGKTNDEDTIVGGGETKGRSILDLLFFHISLERSAAVGRWHLEFAEAEEMGDYVIGLN